MKSLLSWMTDPFVHLVLVVILLVHFSMSYRSDSETEPGPNEPTRCQKCDLIHVLQSPCPLVRLNPGPTAVTP